MKFIQVINNYISQSNPQYLLPFVLGLIVIAVVLWIINTKKPKGYYFGNFLLMIFFIRLLLFAHPYPWELYHNHLSVDDVGWRQQSAIFMEYYKYFQYPGKKYLAVGSSQTYTLYEEYSKTHPQLTIFNLAGMTPIDFYLYREYIAARNPGYVLLFLTEFDLAKEPSLPGAKIAPAQGIALFKHWSVLWRLSKEANTQLALKEMVIGEVFPEYKYSFIFKGLFQKLSKRNQALGIKSLYDDQNKDGGDVALRVESIREEMDERWIKYQIYFLNEFLRYCHENAIKVIIVEGQYNPLVENEKTRQLHAITHAKLVSLIQKFPLVSFVDRVVTWSMSKDDFTDGVHFKKESALKFTQKLFLMLDSRFN